MRSEIILMRLHSPQSNTSMKTNVGSYDGAVRFLLGCAILFFSVNGLGWWALLGLLPIISAACGFCPLYWTLGIDTDAWEKRFEERHGNSGPDG
jgi:hypothetical protein